MGRSRRCAALRADLEGLGAPQERGQRPLARLRLDTTERWGARVRSTPPPVVPLPSAVSARLLVLLVANDVPVRVALEAVLPLGVAVGRTLVVLDALVVAGDRARGRGRVRLPAV